MSEAPLTWQGRPLRELEGEDREAAIAAAQKLLRSVSFTWQKDHAKGRAALQELGVPS